MDVLALTEEMELTHAPRRRFGASEIEYTDYGARLCARDNMRRFAGGCDVVDDLIEAMREQRTFSLNDVEKMAWLPSRATVNEPKEFGLVNLIHTKRRSAKPWIKQGLYRLILDGRIYVLEIGPNTTRGQSQCAWLWRPVIRVPARGRA